MSQAPQFVISEFTNPSGEIVFRLTGWLDGKRIRKNFSTRAEAASERQSMEIQQCQAETGIRATATRLSEEQLPACSSPANSAFTSFRPCSSTNLIFGFIAFS
jgi:hypothetical protein